MSLCIQTHESGEEPLSYSSSAKLVQSATNCPKLLVRIKIKIDTSYNNVILSFCEYLYSFLEFANHYNDDSHDEIERLHEAIDEIDTRVNLKMTITNQKTLRDLDKSFSKFDKLSCEEILSHNPPIGRLAKLKSLFTERGDLP